MSTDYQELDAEIISVIASGRTKFYEIHGACRASPHHQLKLWRVVDRRLQALRRKGRIKFDRKAGWSICPATGD